MTGYHQYKVCIDACLRCAAICNYCASSCAKEPDAQKMARCIQLNMECASICYATAEFMSLGSERVPELCKLCASLCDACAAECKKHENMHCTECAAACTDCAEACYVVVG